MKETVFALRLSLFRNKLKASYTGDIEKVKFFLERLIENVVGILTDETGKSTLEIALENKPEDIIKILSNYGFHENALRNAYKCLTIIPIHGENPKNIENQ